MASEISSPAPRSASVPNMLFTEGFEESRIRRCEHFEVPGRPLPCRHRVGLPEDDGRGLIRPELAQRDTSPVEGPTRGRKIQFEVLFGGVDARAEGCPPVATTGREPSFVPRRQRDAHAIADSGADLNGFVEEGERAFATPRAADSTRASQVLRRARCRCRQHGRRAPLRRWSRWRRRAPVR